MINKYNNHKRKGKKKSANTDTQRKLMQPSHITNNSQQLARKEKHDKV